MRIVRVTLAVGIVTALAAGLVAVIGASRLASQQVAARDQAALRLLTDQIVSRLSASEGAASRVTAEAATTSNVQKLDQQLEPIYESSEGIVDQIVIADSGGTVLTALPASIEASGLPQTGVFRDAVKGVTGFRRVTNKDGSWSLWLTRNVLLPKGTPGVVMLHIDTSFLPQLLATASTAGGGTAFAVEAGHLLGRSGSNSPLSLNDARWTPTTRSVGQLSLASDDQSTLVGYYSDIGGIEGIGWRLGIIEPASRVAGDTFIAVAPIMGVLALGGLVAVTAALLVARQLVTPLRELERTAYQAANGSYVSPIPSSGDDEIGQVAAAFNAVALRLNALHDLAKLLASASRLDQVLDGILEALERIVGPGIAVVYLVDDAGEWLVPVRAHGVDLANLRRAPARGDGWLARSLRETETLVHTGEAGGVGTELPGLEHEDAVAITSPLISGREPLGVVAVVRETQRPISEAEREMASTFSAQAAVAVHNSRLFEAETESLRVAEALRAIAERLVRPGGLEDALADVATVVGDLFEAHSVTFVIEDRAALGLPVSSDRVLERTLRAVALAVLPPGIGSRPVCVGEGENELADEALRTLEATTLLVIPVAVESGHGAFLVSAAVCPAYSERDIDLAGAVGSEIALALDNAYFYERALSRAANLETVFRISQAVGSSLQVNVVLNRVLDVVQKILSADAVALMTYDVRKRSVTTAMARGAIPPAFLTLEIQPGEDVPGYVFSTAEPVIFRSLQESIGGIAGDAAHHGLHSMIAVPLLARGRSIGVLIVLSAEEGAFSEEDMSVLQTFASQAALALDTARMYSREHDVADILQQSILPEALPHFDEIDAASVYVPAGADSDIGGDYYDLFKAPDGALWLAIADVCGKGVVAATKTSMIKYTVRALVGAGYRPSQVLGELNRVVSETGEPSDIVTIWAGRADLETHELSWASGGHPPGIVRSETGEIRTLPPTGPLLGAVNDIEYGEETVRLSKGDLIVLYTDGVTEARSGTAFFGDNRVTDAVRMGGTAEDVVQRLLTQVRRWVHGDLRDDVAILAITVLGGAGESGSAHQGEAAT
jgi:serine phosphatase RsbU (regulator of sigma subunit)/HAMP domain-containing protein